MDDSPRAAASADSGTALDGEAGRRNGQDRGERSPVDEQLDRAKRGHRVYRDATANKSILYGKDTNIIEESIGLQKRYNCLSLCEMSIIVLSTMFN